MQGRHCVAFFANNVFSLGIGVGEMDYGSWSLGGWGGLPPKLSVLLGAPPGPAHSFCPLAVFDCRTFQLNKGKHQCFAEGLKSMEVAESAPSARGLQL